MSEKQKSVESRLVEKPGFLLGGSFLRLLRKSGIETLRQKRHRKNSAEILDPRIRRKADIVGIIDEQTEEDEKVTILAQSMGSIESVDYAAEHPEKVSGVILLNPIALDYQPSDDEQRGYKPDDYYNIEMNNGSNWAKRMKLVKAAGRLMVSNVISALKPSLEDRFNDDANTNNPGLKQKIEAIEGPKEDLASASRTARFGQLLRRYLESGLIGASDIRRTAQEVDLAGYASLRDSVRKASSRGVHIDVVLSNKDEFSEYNDSNSWAMNDKGELDRKGPLAALIDDNGELLENVSVSTVNHPDANHEWSMSSPGILGDIIGKLKDKKAKVVSTIEEE